MSRFLRLTPIIFLFATVVPPATATQENAEQYINRGVALHKQGELDDAIVSFRKAIELDPSDASAHYSLGKALRDKGQLDAAIASYRRAIEFQPDNAMTHYHLAHALWKPGQLDAVIAFSKVDAQYCVAPVGQPLMQRVVTPMVTSPWPSVHIEYHRKRVSWPNHVVGFGC